jgi:DNA polymerase-3 subunit delta
MDATDFLNEKKPPREPVYVLAGEEDFLKRRVLDKLKPLLIGESDADLAFGIYSGDKAEFSTIRNELETLPFLCERRVVLVDQADVFVKNFRSQLEGYVIAPSKNGVLILDVKSWAANTKLSKLVPDSGTVVCKAPQSFRLVDWAIRWGRDQYEKTLTKPAAQMLLDYVGPHMGLLDQELQKLSIYLGDEKTIQPQDVDRLVGKSNHETVFKILDAMGEANSELALGVLRDQFQEGAEPLAILGALGYSLRRLVQVAREYHTDRNLDAAMDRVGIPNFPNVRENTRKQLKHLGGARIDRIYDLLIECELNLKGNSPLPAGLILERLILSLSRVPRGT